MKKPRVFLFLAVFILTAALLIFASLNISNVEPITDYPPYDHQAGPGLHLGFGWQQSSLPILCELLPHEALSKGFPFAYERETRLCGRHETNDIARFLNIAAALMVALALGKFLSASLYRNRAI